MPPMPDVAELMQAEMPRQLRGQQHRPPVEAYARKRLSALPSCGADAAAASPERTLIPALHPLFQVADMPVTLVEEIVLLALIPTVLIQATRLIRGAGKHAVK